MAERKNTGIAVPDAKRLNDCYHELSEAIAAPPADKPLMPPEAQFVTLSHALTWIAFGVSMDSDQLHEVLTLDRYGERDPQEAVKAAVAQLVDLGRGGRIAMEGKYRESHRDETRTLLTAPIEPTNFANYRQFNYLEDSLCLGTGLFWESDGSDSIINEKGYSAFIEIGVSRADLLREFPPKGGGIVPANRQLDHAEITGKAAAMLREQPGLSKGSAAASIRAELPPNPKTGKPRDQRGLERIIGHLWEGKVI
ncbi:MAG: hypothetical protein K2Y17_08345 [Qipengyuania sp.]|nr:hypothetical protein [Qipengyuania sp.]